jgi:hypothetical protein
LSGARQNFYPSRAPSPLGDSSQLANTVWFWDPAGSNGGSDANDGLSSSTPLLTWAEFYARTYGLDYGSGTVQVKILSNIPDQNLDVNFKCGVLYIHADLVPVQGATGTVTSFVSINKATNTAWQVTDTNRTNSWTTDNLVGKLLVARDAGSGAVTGTTVIDRDLGSKTFRAAGVSVMQNYVFPAIPGVSSTAGAFHNGDTYQVYDQLTCSARRINAWGPSNMIITVYGLRFLNSFTSSSYPLTAIHCTFAAALGGFGAGVAASLILGQCLVTETFTWSASGGSSYFSTFHGDLQVNSPGSYEWSTDNVLSNGGFMNFTHGAQSVASATDIGVFDLAGGQVGIGVAHSARLCVGQIWGNNNAGTVIKVAVGYLLYVTTPTATTSGTQVAIDMGPAPGAPTNTFAYTDLPQFPDGLRGIGYGN